MHERLGAHYLIAYLWLAGVLLVVVQDLEVNVLVDDCSGRRTPNVSNLVERAQHGDEHFLAEFADSELRDKVLGRFGLVEASLHLEEGGAALVVCGGEVVPY